MRRPCYNRDLDIITVALDGAHPGGSIAALVTGWADPINRIGELDSETDSKMATQPMSANFETIAPPSRAAWRAWLAEHHADSPGVWLIIHKKNSPQPGVTYIEAVEEALCFGWIDSKTITLDATRFRPIFTPRKPRGTWAKSNKERVARLAEDQECRSLSRTRRGPTTPSIT